MSAPSSLPLPIPSRLWAGMARCLQFSENGAMMLLAVLVGLACGFAAVGFHELVAETAALAGRFQDWSATAGCGWLAVLLTPVAGAALAAGLVWFFARHDTCHGTAGVMEAVALRGGRLAVRPLGIKVAGAGVLIGSGGSAGPEDPSVQIGAAIGSFAGMRLRLSDTRLKGLVAAGVASAIAASFNAPIAGVFFALEVVACEFGTQLFAPVVLAAVAGSIVGRAYLGAQPAFIVPSYELLNPLVETPLYVLLGVVAAMVGTLFVSLLFRAEGWFRATRLPKVGVAALGGLLMGTIAVAFPAACGVGYDVAGQILNGGREAEALAAGLLVAKLLATVITVGAVGLGGTFAPSLVLGAAAGSLFGQVVHGIWPQHTAPAAAYALVGMGAVLTAVIRAPLTAVLLLFEVTGDYHIILPIMASVVTSTLFAQRLFAESIYTERLLRKGIQLRFGRDVNILEVVTVGEVMTRAPETVATSLPLGALAKLFNETHHHGMLVVDDDDRLCGIVTLSDLSRAIAKGLPDETPVAQFATRNLVCVYPEQSLNEALRALAQADVGRLPVVNREAPDHLLGVLRRNDIIRAYNRMALRREELDYRRQQMEAGSQSGGSLLQFAIPADSPFDGRMIRDLRLPHQAVISGIRRGEQSLIPRGQVILQAGDQLTVIVAAGHGDEVLQVLREGQGSSEGLHYRETVVAAGCPAAHRAVASLKLPRGLLLVSLRREGVLHTVNGQSTLLPGDELTMIASAPLLKSVEALFLPPPPPPPG